LSTSITWRGTAPANADGVRVSRTDYAFFALGHQHHRPGLGQPSRDLLARARGRRERLEHVRPGLAMQRVELIEQGAQHLMISHARHTYADRQRPLHRSVHAASTSRSADTVKPKFS
jgi:hypothetical protein